MIRIRIVLNYKYITIISCMSYENFSFSIGLEEFSLSINYQNYLQLFNFEKYIYWFMIRDANEEILQFKIKNNKIVLRA